MTTRANLIITVADMLGISEAGQELSAEDSVKVGRYVNSSCNDLRARAVCDIDPTEEVPDECELALAQYIAYKAASAYNMNPSVLQAKFDGKTANMLEGDLKAVLGAKPTYAPMQLNYM